MSGWFAVKRGITEHPLFMGSADRIALWVWLLDHAAWKETRHNIKGVVVTIMPGQLCASERRMAAGAGVGRQVVRTMLDNLEANQMITRNLTHGRTIVTLCNWDKYQNDWRDGNPKATHEQPKPNPQKKQGNKGTTNNPPTPRKRGDEEGKVVQLRSISGTGHKAAMAEALRILNDKGSRNA